VKEKITDCQNTDRLDINSIKPYDITNSYYMARLYVVPKRKMPYYHDAIMSIIINSLNITLDKNFNIQQLENAAAIDPLTNCYNRRALEKLMANDIAYCKRQRNELSVIMLDMDNFKEINDMYGHQAGDAVLKDVSTLIPSAVRKSDYLARYGGEEFVLVLPNSTLYNTVQLAHKLKHMIERHTVNVGGNSISVTASFGVASLETKKDADSLLREADERLYKAKSLGKNIVVPSLLPCFADSKFVIRDDARKYSRVCVT